MTFLISFKVEIGAKQYTATTSWVAVQQETRNSALAEDNAQPFTCLSILFMKIPAN